MAHTSSLQDSSHGKRSAYVFKQHRATAEQFAFVNELTAGLSDKTQALFRHLVGSSLAKLRKDEGWVPLASTFIKKHFRDADVEALKSRGLLQIDPSYSRPRHQSRMYRASMDVLERYVDLAPVTPEAFLGTSIVDLLTGKTSTNMRRKSSLNSESRHPYPEVIRSALQKIGPSVFDADAVHVHLEALGAEARRRREASEALLKAPVSEERTAARRANLRSMGRYVGDKACYQAVLSQRPVKRQDGLYEYPPAYSVQSTGRIGHVEGGLQSCTRAMKAAAFSSVPGVHNYDLASSQPRLALHLMAEAGLGSTWLKTYVDDADAKHRVAKEIGVSVDTWKACFVSLMFGASVPSAATLEARHKERMSRRAILDKPELTAEDHRALRKPQILSAISDALLEALPLDQALSALGRFSEVTKPLVSDLSTLIDHLDDRARDAREGRVLNAVGMRLSVTNLNDAERRRKVAAHMLQGLEALYIHSLTVAATEAGILVMANEHDGLITQGEIPEALWSGVAERLGLAGAIKLVEKPFETDDPGDDGGDDDPDSCFYRVRRRRSRPDRTPGKRGTRPERPLSRGLYQRGKASIVGQVTGLQSPKVPLAGCIGRFWQ